MWCFAVLIWGTPPNPQRRLNPIQSSLRSGIDPARRCNQNCVAFGFLSMLSSVWRLVRFRRSSRVRGAFVLEGVPEFRFEAVCARLFLLGAEFVSCGCSRFSPGWVWVCFRCGPVLAGRLALVFPCEGVAPLVVSASGRLLSGAAEVRARASRSRSVSFQRAVGRRFWGC